MRALRSLAAVTLSLLAACGGDSAPNGTAEDTFIREYCDLTSKCCAQATDAVDCARAFTLFQTYLPRRFDAGKAGACLARLREARACDFSDAEDDCGRVLGETQRSGSAAAGAACQTTADCALSSEGETVCHWAGSTGTCRLTVDGAPGAACDGTRRGKITVVEADSDDKPRLVTCDAAKGLVCGQSRVCAPLGAPGAPCSTSNECSSQICQASACVGRAELGASCAGVSCVDDGYCDETTRCAQKLAAGAACVKADQCASRQCDGGSCGAASGSPPLGCFSTGD